MRYSNLAAHPGRTNGPSATIACKLMARDPKLTFDTGCLIFAVRQNQTALPSNCRGLRNAQTLGANAPRSSRSRNTIRPAPTASPIEIVQTQS